MLNYSIIHITMMLVHTALEIYVSSLFWENVQLSHQAKYF